jgi:hypothetical protein
MPCCKLFVHHRASAWSASFDFAVQKSNNTDVVKQQFAVLWSIKLVLNGLCKFWEQMDQCCGQLPCKIPSALLSSISRVCKYTLEMKVSVMMPNASIKLILVLPVASLVIVMMKASSEEA